MSLIKEALKLSGERAKLGWDGSCKGCKNLVAEARCFVGNTPAACLACWEPELTVKAPAIDLSLPNKNGDIFPGVDLNAEFAKIESVDLKVTPDMVFSGAYPLIFKGYSHRGYHTSETVTLVGYEKLVAFIKEETEKNNAFEFHFWVST